MAHIPAERQNYGEGAPAPSSDPVFQESSSTSSASLNCIMDTLTHLACAERYNYLLLAGLYSHFELDMPPPTMYAHPLPHSHPPFPAWVDPSAPPAPAPAPPADGGVGGAGGGDGERVTVGINSSVLDCPVCFDPLRLPLFQCTNGHLMCSLCCIRLNNKCPVCTFSVSRIRCSLLESIIEANKTPCPYARFGCLKTSAYNLRQTHKDSCLYAPCYCPVPGCRFRGHIEMLSSHLESHQHSFKQKCFTYGRTFRISLPKEESFYIIRVKDDLQFLLLNTQNDESGNALSVICIRPGSGTQDLQYELEVKGDAGKKLRLHGSPENVRKWRENCLPKFYLFVPSDISAADAFDISICIRKIS